MPESYKNALKSSPNTEINSLWVESSFGCNIQYDHIQNTKQVLNAIQKDNENRIRRGLKSQVFSISSILIHASQKTRSLWSTVQQHMPINFNFTIKYLNNTLASRENLNKWAISRSSVYSFCLKAEALQHVLSSCTVYHDGSRYSWRHNSVLLFLVKTLASWSNCLIYADLPLFLFPFFIARDSLRLDIA